VQGFGEGRRAVVGEGDIAAGHAIHGSSAGSLLHKRHEQQHTK
jgi:hypothetical protein